MEDKILLYGGLAGIVAGGGTILAAAIFGLPGVVIAAGVGAILGGLVCLVVASLP